ncbi:MAG: hypothetical protein ACK5OW_01345 [bacterium]|jgi:hypothetical protein
MGKAKKEHRKRVEARNRRIEQARKSFRDKFREELLKEIELEKARRIAENPELMKELEEKVKEEGEKIVETNPNDTETIITKSIE